jgi:serine/threonine-protein phosphatase 5
MSESSDSEGAASDASTPRLEVTDEQKAQSEELKTKANTKFQENHFAEATEFYTKAIELNPRNHILFANRAFCHIKMENYGRLFTVC